MEHQWPATQPEESGHASARHASARHAFVRSAKVTSRIYRKVDDEVRMAMQPPVEYGVMERYRAFAPGRNVGVRDSLNAPVSKRIAATAMDVAIYTTVLLAALLTLSIGFNQPWWWAVLLLGPVPFYAWQSAFDAGGGSVGKRLMGLRVVGPADTPIDVGDACRRNLWLLLPMIPIAGPVAALAVGGWYAAAAKADAFGMAPHDRFARTRVILKPEHS